MWIPDRIPGQADPFPVLGSPVLKYDGASQADPVRRFAVPVRFPVPVPSCSMMAKHWRLL
jgi:hypothetical protein